MRTAASAPSVLMVEDHPALRRFSELALQPLELRLHPVDSLAAARRWLEQHGRPDLLLSDLMLPDGSGIDLIIELRGRGWSAELLPVIVLTAAVDAAERPQLTSLGVSAILIKPVQIDALTSAVETALAARHACAEPQTEMPAVVTRHFAGDRRLFEQFRAECLHQLPMDIAAADAAAADAGRDVLRRIAHDLKSLLHMLGESEAAELAASLESEAAGSGAWSQLTTSWSALRGRLQAMLDN